MSSNTNEKYKKIMLPIFCPFKCKNKHHIHTFLFYDYMLNIFKYMEIYLTVKDFNIKINQYFIKKNKFICSFFIYCNFQLNLFLKYFMMFTINIDLCI